MKNIYQLFKINISTYIIILTFLFTGLFKNILLIYLIIIIHELGHIFIIKLLRYKIIKVEIYPMGGITTINKPLNSSIYHELLIAIFGVIFQIILFLIFFKLFKASLISLNTYNLFLKYNKTILIFNLLPIIPLDGYNFFKSILELFFSYQKSFYLSQFISIIFILLFITYNHVYSLNNYLIISFLIYKIYIEYKNFKFKHLKFLLERHLNTIDYHKIKYNNKIDLNVLKKDTYHYFKTNKDVYSEKKVLAKKFNKI